MSPNFQALKFFGKAPELWGYCAFPQNFNTKKLGEITLFHAVFIACTKE